MPSETKTTEREEMQQNNHRVEQAATIGGSLGLVLAYFDRRHLSFYGSPIVPRSLLAATQDVAYTHRGRLTIVVAAQMTV